MPIYLGYYSSAYTPGKTCTISYSQFEQVCKLMLETDFNKANDIDAEARKLAIFSDFRTFFSRLVSVRICANGRNRPF